MPVSASPPHNAAAEQGVLGALLYDNSLLSRVSGLTPDHFHNPVHGRIFDATKVRIESGRLADAIILKNQFARDEALSGVDVAEYLAGLVYSAPSGGAVGEYGKIVMDYSNRRELIDIGRSIAGSAQDPDLEHAQEVTDTALSALVKLQRNGTGRSAFATTQDAATALLDNDAPVEIKTGFESLDKISGFVRGGLTILGGRASMGKSALLIEAAFSCARRGLRVDLFSLEMGREQIAARAISSAMRRDGNSVPYQNIYRRDYRPDRIEELKVVARGLPTLNLDDSPGLTVSDIKARCLDKPGKLDVVFIDYLNIMGLSDVRDVGRHDQQIGLVASRLRNFAKDTGAAIVLLCQLNRGSANRDNNVPQLHDLRDSGELEQHADSVMFIHREYYYLKRKHDARIASGDTPSMSERSELHALENVCHVIVAKQRMGRTGFAPLYCDMPFNFIREA